MNREVPDPRFPRVARVLGRPPVVAFGLVMIRIGVGLLVAKFAVSTFVVRGIAPGNRMGARSLPGSFLHWDALYFLDVARHGYSANVLEHTAVSPVFPHLTRWVARGLHVPYLDAGLAVNWFAMFVAAWGLIVLSNSVWLDRPPGHRAAALLLFFPASVFLLAPYSEATFIALTVWALVLAVRGHPYWGAAVAGLASAARPEGAVVAAALALWALWRRKPFQAVAVGVLGALGVGAVTLFFHDRYGHWFEQLSVQGKLWNRHATWPFHPLAWSFTSIMHGRAVADPPIESNAVAVFMLDDVLTVLAVIGVIFLVSHTVANELARPLAILAVLQLAVIVSNGPYGRTPESADRLIMCIVPLYLLAPRLRSERWWTALITLSAGFAAVFQLLFNLGYWFT